VLRTLRARRLAQEHRLLDARTAAEDARDDLLNVIGFGLVAALVGGGAFFLSGNEARVRSVLFNWDLIWSSRTALMRGFWWNVKLFVVAEVLVLVWALIIAVVRQLPGRAFGPMRGLAIVYADVFRGIPTIIVIYLVVFGFPLAGVEPFASHMSGETQLFWLGTFSLVLVYGAYVAEVYRAGLESIHWSQTAAARSLGLSQWQTLRHVVIPQAVRRILPPLLNDFVALQKDTALVGLVGLAEILNVAGILKNNHFNLSPVTGAAIFFLVVTIPFTRLVDYLIKRDKERTQGG
jgi:polar amino acid transport system permease protein